MKAAGGLGPDTGKTGGSLDKDTLPADNESAYANYDSANDPYANSGDSGGGGGGGGGGGDNSYSGDDGSGGTGDTGSDDTGTAPDAEDDTTVDAETDTETDADADTDTDADTDADADDSVDAETDPETDDSLTQVEPETGRPSVPVDPDEPRPPNYVSFDVEAMTRLVAAMERAGEQIHTLRDEMRTILSDVRLSTSVTDRFEEVSAWISDELPDLRRRLALAQDLTGEGNGLSTQPDVIHQRPYVDDETRIPTCPPSESYDNGRHTAQRFTVSHDSDTTRGLIAELRAGRHDPYYAREFAHTTDPETLVRTIVSAGDGDGSAELTQLTAATVATAARGTADLAPPAGYDEQWAALRESDDPEVAAAAAQLRPA